MAMRKPGLSPRRVKRSYPKPGRKISKKLGGRQLPDIKKLYAEKACVCCGRETTHIYCQTIMQRKGGSDRSLRMVYACLVCGEEYNGK